MSAADASPLTPRALVARAERCRADGDRPGAEAAYHAALTGDPGFAPAWFGLGTLALESGASAQAVALIGRAIQLRPRPGWHAALSAALLAEGQAEAARAAAHVAVLKDPGEASHHHAHALALEATGAREAALEAWRAVVRHAPRDPAAHANLAASLYRIGRLDEAAQAIGRARALGPATAATLLTEGLIRDALGEVEAADGILAEAERLAPDVAAIGLGRAGVLIERDRFNAAERRLRAVLASGPQPQAGVTLANLLLATGRRAEGWAAFEARHALAAAPADALPLWDGRAVDGVVRIEAEQGLGDALHFLRYLPLAAARTPVVVRVPASLRRLVAEAFPDIALDDGETCVARTGLPSLPHLLGDPAADPVWVRPPEARVATWRAIFAHLPGLRVGLAWQGNPEYRYDRRRSVDAALLAPFATVPDVSFVALQPGLAAPAWTFTPGGLDDFAETAAAMAALDLIVSVDTATAHLAGSAGRPLWLLDRAGGDWRWRDAFGAALYPTLRRFVQAAPHPPAQAWPPVVDDVRAALHSARD